ncbi:hypothetical protein BC940DRAFT_295076 [Gongronella butleri]|nr:hypothetical protein BC940DRAFT_295076 [Gongronella butleri]
MKIQALILGQYYPADARQRTFQLFRFPVPLSPPLQQVNPSDALYYYCLNQLDQLGVLSLRHASLEQLYRDFPSTFCKDAHGQLYASTRVLVKLPHASDLLVDLCYATEHTSATKWAALLDRIDMLSRTNAHSITVVDKDLTPMRLQGHELFFSRTTSTAPVTRLSPPHDLPTTKTVSSSLLLQRRLAPKQKTAHLTIHTPTYRDHHTHSVRTAPLRKSMSRLQLNRRLHQALTSAGASDVTAQHSSSRLMHAPALPATPASASSTAAPPPTTPHAPQRPSSSITFAQLRRQEFIHPFETLHDTIEDTRRLKSQLDDNIRKSSMLMTKFQAQQPEIERNVKQQVHAVFVPYLQQLDAMVDRINRAETAFNNRKNASMAPSTLATQENAMQDEIKLLLHRIDQLEQKLAASTPSSS